MLPNTSQTVYWDSNQYQMEDESRKRSREEEAWSEARTSTHSFTCNPPQAQPPPPLFTSAFTEAFENSNPRPQKRLREGATSATRISEQAIAPTLQETDPCATSGSYHSQIPPSQANTFRRWNEVSGDYGTYDYSRALASAETTIGAPYHTPYDPGMIPASCESGSNDQYRTTYDAFIPPGAAQNTALALQGAHNFTIRDQAHIMSVGTISNVNHYGQLFGLDIMDKFMEKYISLNATHDSPVQDPDRICHPETRRNVLKQIHDWADNPDGRESIFWLHGPAGAGKSAIAQTIARSYCRQRVAATFFFYRSDPSRNDGNKLFTTIAWQLALLIPAIKTHIINSLNERPDLPRKDIETQFQELIIRPLQTLISASSETQLSSLIIIIDGVDECVDEKLQRRFLTVIGNAVNDPDFPLRFLICSRPEAHIEETIDRFQRAPLRLDLAKLDDAHHDIEKYLRAEFSRIASEQDIDPTWPGDERIRKCVYKSSGHFVYASTVIKIVDDEYNSATTQLDIVLGLKPNDGKSVFAELDGLYMEILKRQRDQAFLNDILSLLTGYHLASYPLDIGKYATIMSIPEKELCRKLRGMRSLLKLDRDIAVHHRSFLDFLQDSSRSGQYHISKRAAVRRYSDLITASIVRYVSIIFEQPDCHEQHFRLWISLDNLSTLSVEELQQALQPLVNIQEKLLIMEKSSWQRLLKCDECNILSVVWRLLLYLTCYRETSKQTVPHSVQDVEQSLIEHAGTLGPPTPFVAIEVEQVVLENSDLDVCLSSVLAHLRETKFPPSAMIINLMCSLLNFDYVETAMRVRSISDGQLLVDAIDYLINNEDFLKGHSTAITRGLARFAIVVHRRVPVLPSSLFSLGDLSQRLIMTDPGSLFTPMFMARILDRNYVLRVSCVFEKGECAIVHDSMNTFASLKEWRRSKPSSVMMLRVMLEVAKATQYLDSMDILFMPLLELIFLDSECHVKIFPWCNPGQKMTQSPSEEMRHWNILKLGAVFYELYFDVAYQSHYKNGMRQDPERPSEPEISEEHWQVIQRCCAGDPKSRPTIDEVVQEMESCKLD